MMGVNTRSIAAYLRNVQAASPTNGVKDMKRVLIVHAHPEPQSFSAAMKNAAESELLRLGCEVRTTDLYAIGFNPVARAEDFENRAQPDYLTYALEQRNAFTTKTLAAD